MRRSPAAAGERPRSPGILGELFNKLAHLVGTQQFGRVRGNTPKREAQRAWNPLPGARPQQYRPDRQEPASNQFLALMCSFFATVGRRRSASIRMTGCPELAIERATASETVDLPSPGTAEVTMKELGGLSNIHKAQVRAQLTDRSWAIWSSCWHARCFLPPDRR